MSAMKNRRSLCILICLCFLFISSLSVFISINKFHNENSSLSSLNTTETFLAVVITSSGQNFKKRNSIRNTWLKLSSQHVKHIFVIGTEDPKYNKDDLLTEIREYRDILLLPGISDSYHALSRKMLQAFVHLNTFWKYKFVLKCDDDSFARLADIESELRTRFLKIKNLYWGFFSGNAHVKRKGKWMETKWILCDRYLPYALGGGYVLSQSMIQFIAQNYKYLNIFQTEDVSVGTWLAPVNVTRIHDPRFDTEYISRGCSNTYLVTHKHDETNMKYFYQNLRNRGNLCDTEYKLRLSYLYNWDIEPSKCCIRHNATIP